MTAGHITVYDIAREAGVSVATVSRVLNGTAPVRESTRRMVNTLIEKYRFQPNALARSLVKKTTGMIGIMIPDIQNMFFLEVIRGVEEAAREFGYAFVLCETRGLPERESEYLSLLREKQVDGIVIMGGRVNLVRCPRPITVEIEQVAQRIPVVVVNGKFTGKAVYQIRTDEYAGALMALRHLIASGYREIGFLGGKKHITTTLEKWKAYQEVLAENGCRYHDDWVLFGGYNLESGRMLMNRFLDMPNRPSAVFCINDYTAIGAIKSVLGQGLVIPDDIAVAGYDDTQLAQAVTPELTTVTQNSHELGKRAITTIYRVLHKQKVPKMAVLQPQLVVRNSTIPGN